jgi:hypothetical protein
MGPESRLSALVPAKFPLTRLFLCLKRRCSKFGSLSRSICGDPKHDVVQGWNIPTLRSEVQTRYQAFEQRWHRNHAWERSKVMSIIPYTLH